MNNVFLTSMVALGLSFGAASFAQDTTTPAAEETTTEAAEEAKTEAPKVEEAQPEVVNKDDEKFPISEDGKTKKVPIGTEIVKSEHGDWKVACFVLPEGEPERCRLYQLLVDKDDNPVAQYYVSALAEAAKAEAGVDFISPLGTLLTSKATMRVDAGKAQQYPFGWCDALGCIARYGLTKTEVDNMKKGSKAVMTIVAAADPKNPIELNLSLTGFTAAWNALKGK
ncbi:invasion associated locus B family protein [Amylibacter sp. SFDW26]|uniref:invasion associated locus B family protein n=1 Tax=Amylibacter sp. SFDW26 TaxID=2652722 RepID=UPI0012619DE0|nr:invasion associated locus B family protein [Amylibacter sp. SFDW26]KAB7615610.1 invasion associated locus B family protein [Amylibacter sp. SFDW26]